MFNSKLCNVGEFNDPIDLQFEIFVSLSASANWARIASFHARKNIYGSIN